MRLHGLLSCYCFCSRPEEFLEQWYDAPVNPLHIAFYKAQAQVPAPKKVIWGWGKCPWWSPPSYTSGLKWQPECKIYLATHAYFLAHWECGGGFVAIKDDTALTTLLRSILPAAVQKSNTSGNSENSLQTIVVAMHRSELLNTQALSYQRGRLI